MGLLNLVLWGAGGFDRDRLHPRAVRLPVTRRSRSRDANVARYEAWRHAAAVPTRAHRSLRRSCAASPDRSPGCRRVRARVRGLPRALTPTGDPSNLDRGAAIHHDGEPRLGCNRGGLPVDDPELEPQTASPMATASRACGTTSSDRRKTSTRSNGPVAATAASSVANAGTPETPFLRVDRHAVVTTLDEELEHTAATAVPA